MAIAVVRSPHTWRDCTNAVESQLPIYIAPYSTPGTREVTRPLRNWIPHICGHTYIMRSFPRAQAPKSRLALNNICIKTYISHFSSIRPTIWSNTNLKLNLLSLYSLFKCVCVGGGATSNCDGRDCGLLHQEDLCGWERVYIYIYHICYMFNI